MALALEQAQQAARDGDVPVGAVLVAKGELLAIGRNLREVDQDPTAHAEIVALRAGAAARGNWRLGETTLYVTLEPCAMCAGALVNARVTRLVYGTTDPKAGAVTSLMALCTDSRLNHRLEVIGGVLAEPCGEILREFFRARRKRA